MFPVLFSIGNISISSFGVFLALGFLFGVFLVWRLSRAWDLDEEKILDLTLLTFLGGFLGARAYFVLENFQFFIQSPLKIIIFTHFPGFSFWGGFLGGWLSLFYFTRRLRLDFWQIADIASVGFLGGLIFSNIGCLLGGCSIGIASKLFFAVPQVGVIGKRLPISGFEALLLIFVLFIIWSRATKFHLRGKIVSLSLIYIGIVKLLMEPFKQKHDLGYVFSTVLIILGLTILYRITKRNFLLDLKNLSLFPLNFFTDPRLRKIVIDRLNKTWYNQKTSFSWKFRNIKKIARRLNVRFSYKNNRID